MIPNKLIVTLVELLIRKTVEKNDTGNGPSFKIIIASMLGMAGLMLTYNYSRLSESAKLVFIPDKNIEYIYVQSPETRKEIDTLKLNLDTCIVEKDKYEKKFDELLSKVIDYPNFPPVPVEKELP